MEIRQCDTSLLSTYIQYTICNRWYNIVELKVERLLDIIYHRCKKEME